MRHLILAAAAVCALGPAASPASARVWQKSWTVTETPTVHVLTNDGRVHVHRGASGTVSAHIVFEARVWGWHGEVREPEVVLEQSGNTLRVVARERGSWTVFGGISEKFEIDVTVPDSCDLQVRSGDGSVEVEPLAGRISLETGDGHIQAVGLKGALSFWTGDGGVDAEDLDGTVTAHSGDGHVHVSGRFDRLDVRTGDGRVEATARRGSQLAEEWNFETGDGGVLLRIPRNLQAFLDASTRDGHLRVDLPISVRGVLSGQKLQGELNGGRTPLRIRTGDGSVTLALAE